MANEYLIKQTLKLFTYIVNKLINPAYKMPQGGESLRVMTNAIARLEKKYGEASISRIVDYIVCASYVFKNREQGWKLNSVFGPKSIERFTTDKGLKYYEDKGLMTENMTRNDLIKFLTNDSQHPLSKFIYIASEESTKRRLLNQEVGYIICQSSTLGWTPESESCKRCDFTEKCKAETSKKYPEIYRLRIEAYESKNNN